jgi:glyoxylase-like metal-dependent hydrolase (beta-lactamase superfamily II)
MASSRIAYGPVVGCKAGRYGTGSNTHSICYRIGRTLIDTGPPNQWRHIRPFVEAEAEDPGIDRVVVTHHHEDHAGNARAIQEMLDVPVYAPADSIDRLREGFSIETYRWIVWGQPTAVEAEPVPDILTLADGTKLRTIPAPGHSDDMVCYHAEAHGLLFTGDLYITSRPQYLRFDEDVHRLIRSIHEALDHDFSKVLCAHRGPVDDGRAALREKVKYLEALCGVVQRRYRSDKQSIDAITREILGSEGMLYYISGGDFSKRNLVSACLSPSTEEDSSIVSANPA